MPEKAFKNMFGATLQETLKGWKNESARLCLAITTTQRDQKENISEQVIKSDTLKLFKQIVNKEEDLVVDYLLKCNVARLRKVSMKYYELFATTIYDHAADNNFKPFNVFYMKHLIPSIMNVFYYFVYILYFYARGEDVELIFTYLLNTAVKIDKRITSKIYREISSDSLTDAIIMKLKPPVGPYFAGIMK